jgi:hypothetical protein
MFVQIITGPVSDKERFVREGARWQRDLKPGATGFVGGTWGLGSGGMGICVAQFESETAAKANSDRPEQGEWWAAIEPAFGDVTFRDTTDVDVIAQPHAPDAGFVQLIQGRVKDPEGARAFMQGAEDQLREARPDIVGGLVAWHGVDGEFTQVMYFTSQEAARAGEKAMEDDEVGAAYEEMMATEPTFVDVFEPHVYCPPAGGAPAARSRRAAAGGRRGAAGSGARSPFQEAPHVGGLAGVLDRVVEDADQAHAEGDGWVPVAVHDPVEVVGRQGGQVLDGARLDRVVVLGEGGDALGPDPRHLLGGVPVADVVGMGGEPEAGGPAVGHPHLLGPDVLGDVGVLHPGDVPHQPADRVGAGLGGGGQVLGREPVGDLVDVLVHP